MSFVIIIIILLAFMLILKFIYDYDLKNVKQAVENKELDELVKKYPSNKEICKWYLKKLKNENVKIEEDPKATASLYIAITNKIIIANISENYARIQTLAHECLHSKQNNVNIQFHIF